MKSTFNNELQIKFIQLTHFNDYVEVSIQPYISTISIPNTQRNAQLTENDEFS